MTRQEFIDLYNGLNFDDPCPEEHMHGRCDGRYPCHILRQIYSMTDDDEIKLKLRKVTTMVRKMSFRLSVPWEVFWDEGGQ